MVKIEFNGWRVVVWIVALLMTAPFFIPCAHAIQDYFKIDNEIICILIYSLLWVYFGLVKKIWEVYDSNEW